MKIAAILIGAIFTVITSHAISEERVELKTTFIKGNKELPQVLYIVPWKEVEKEKNRKETLILHSLFGDAFDPVTPKNLGHNDR